jgi:hypothetical protein
MRGAGSTWWWLAIAIALPACMRGCEPGCSCDPPPQRCTEQSDCTSGTCLHGYCVNDDYAATEARCRTSAACAERGECGAVRKSSFLGLDPGYECAALSDESCRRSQRCLTHGLCAMRASGLGCQVGDPAQCRASQRCTTHEECESDGTECVRRWTGCPALVVPEAPLWAAPVELVWDYDSLRAPWHPGDVNRATIACRVEGRADRASSIRIAGQCATGPRLDGGGAAKLLRADVTLHAGDTIAIAAQNNPAGHAADSSFAQLRYDGNSPLLGGSGGESIECVVVPHDLARERSRRELAAVDQGLVTAAREPPDPSEPRAVSTTIESARVHAGRAALWLGWRDPELAARVRRLDAAASAWEARLEAAIQRLGTSKQPIRTSRMVVTRGNRLCGDSLRAHRGSGAAPVDATTCAFEIAVENTSHISLSLSSRGAPFDDVSDLTWLYPAHDGQPLEIVPATILEIRVGLAVAATDPVQVAPGQRAVVLVDGAAPAAILRGRIGLSDRFTLRP